MEREEETDVGGAGSVRVHCQKEAAWKEEERSTTPDRGVGTVGPTVTVAPRGGVVFFMRRTGALPSLKRY
jgi:hypothetical protein